MINQLTPKSLRRNARTCDLIEIERYTEALNPKTYHVRRYFSGRPYVDLIEIDAIDRLVAFIEREGLGNVVIVKPAPETETGTDPWADIGITL